MSRSTSELSPTNPLDYVTVTFIVAGALLMIAGNTVILCNRNYLPIKSKSVVLTVLSSAGGLLWISAALVVNNHFPRHPNSIFAVCALWTYWLWTFGFALWLNCLTLRLILLHHIFVRKRDPPKCPYLILVPLLLPVIVFCIAATIKKGIEFILFKSTKGDCKFLNKDWAYGQIALLLLYFLLFLGFSFQLRNAMAQFNEYRLIRQGGILSLFVFLLSLVTIETSAYDKAVGRSFLSAAIASAVFYYFWGRNGDVIYHTLYHRETYERRFIADLTRWPSDRERGNFPASFRNMELQLQRVKGEVQQCEDHKRQLESEVSVMEWQCTLLQQNAHLTVKSLP